MASCVAAGKLLDLSESQLGHAISLALVPQIPLRQTRAGEARRRIGAWLRVSASQVLVVSQIAVSLLLLVEAGLFLRTLTKLNAVELGFNREHLLLVSVNARQAGYQDAALIRYYDNLENRLRGIPGVRAASLSSYALASNSSSSSNGRIV